MMRGRAAQARKESGMVMDEERIQNLPYEEYPPAESCIKTWTKQLSRHYNAPPLFLSQALSFECLSRSPPRSNRGGVLAIPVGEGKTLVALLAGTVLKSKKVLLLVPASLKTQCYEDRTKWDSHYKVHPNITIMSYEKLSRKEAANFLNTLQPDLIVMDEAHALANQTTRWSRVMSYFHARPTTKAVVMSGTLIQKSLSKYGHLVQLALRGDSPVPLTSSGRAIWEAVLHPFGEHTHNDWCQIRWLVGKEVPPGKQKKEAQIAFRKRFASAPGIVVSTSPSKVSSSLLFSGWHPSTSPSISDAQERLRKKWELPNGDLLADALEFSRAKKQLALGFYYRWDWPNGPDEEWLDARRGWNATVRNVIARRIPGRDSPALVFDAAARGECSEGVMRVFRRWVSVAHRPKPPVVTEAVCKSVLWAAVCHCRKQPKNFLLWYRSVAGVGDRLREMGVKVLRPGDPTPKGESVALPISSFGQGIDGLQHHYAYNMVLETMSSAKGWEQLVGRTHRLGQTAHTVIFDYLNAPPFWSAFHKAKIEAETLQNKTGIRQKLLIGSHGNPFDEDLIRY